MHQWVDAEDLQTGRKVETSTGTRLAVTSTKLHTEDLRASNLTIDGLHTYYVGDEPVLVHNAGCDKFAEDFVAENGGKIHTFMNPVRPRGVLDDSYSLKNVDEPWFHHTVAVLNGKVHDQFTPSGGLRIEDYVKKWSGWNRQEMGF